MTTFKSNRRDFIRTGTAAAFSLGAAGLSLPLSAQPAESERVRGKADACIFIWLGGGAAHIDTFDPKGRGDGKKKPGSYYGTISTAIPGVQVCEHLRRTAPLLDRCAPIRSIQHGISNEHGAATNLMHTGRNPSGTITYPSIGSIVSHELGVKSEAVPAYVVMGYPNIARDPGFLGPQHGYVYLTQTETGPTGFIRPPDVDTERHKRRQGLLSILQEQYQGRRLEDANIEALSSVNEQGFRMAGPEFLSAFDLSKQSKSLRESYGGEFGQRCLLARRLVQAGVRFVEVSFNLNFLNGTGWDTHNQGQLNQHLLIQDLDQAFSALLLDLEKTRLLTTTLVVMATEFGRPPEFDSGGGRGHQSKAFTCLLAGGGLQTGQVIGETDDLGETVVKRPVSVADFHATIHSALGINPARKLYAEDRPVPITDHGQPITELFG
ncbi:MAG: DUF1501 domain-containing protein [Verrucomicrobia bacterium]|nr:DUF1501 domain-containing protein [Verrucomicrobiota bacterium]